MVSRMTTKIRRAGQFFSLMDIRETSPFSEALRGSDIGKLWFRVKLLLKDQAIRPPCKLKSRETDTVVKLSNIPVLLKVLIIQDCFFCLLTVPQRWSLLQIAGPRQMPNFTKPEPVNLLIFHSETNPTEVSVELFQFPWVWWKLTTDGPPRGKGDLAISSWFPGPPFWKGKEKYIRHWNHSIHTTSFTPRQMTLLFSSFLLAGMFSRLQIIYLMGTDYADSYGRENHISVLWLVKSWLSLIKCFVKSAKASLKSKICFSW